ncbi:hypothetical protein ID866_6143 [Astraeus odoratus]|nr:hypothetical protein ID866_6143 [Astraeus odoratus]
MSTSTSKPRLKHSSPSTRADCPPAAKRSRLTDTPTPSSSSSASVSTSARGSSSAASAHRKYSSATPPTDIDTERKASALRVLNVWSQLAERYNRRLDEDDIIDLYSGAIVKDRGVLSGANKDYHIGHLSVQDDHDQEDSEEELEDEDEEADELDLLPRREAGGDADDFKTLLKRVPPLSATDDADDLDEFLEAEKRRREVTGDEDDEGEDLVSLRCHPVREAEEDEEEDTEDGGVSADDSSEDELATWQDVESTPVRPRVSSQDDECEDVNGDNGDHKLMLIEPEIIDITESTESDSDREFSLFLQRPSRKRRRSVSPSPVPQFSPFPSISHPHELSLSPFSSAPPISHQGLPPPVPPAIPFDPVRAQQAQYLLAQAMHQLSYLMSATLPAYSPYPPTPQQSFSPSIPSTRDSSSPSISRTHSQPHHQRARSVATPASRLSLSTLPPSSPTLSSSSSTQADSRRLALTSRARMQSSPRKVSFQIEKQEKSRSTIYRK